MFPISTPDAITAAKLIAAAIDRQTHSLERIAATMEKAIEDFSAKVNAAFDSLGVSVDGVASDVSLLKDEIAALKAAAGSLSAEGQAALDAVAARADGLAGKVADLDAQTAPPTP